MRRNLAASGNGSGGGRADSRVPVEPATVMPLPAAEAHMWSARPGAFADPAQLARLGAILTDEERARADRHRFVRDRRTGLVTRALVRITLSRYCDVPPARWRFRTSEHGRPEIASPASPLRFNVSHADGLVVCLVSRARALGVDAESLRRRRRWLDIAERFFAPAEARALSGVPAARLALRFLEYWTLKESYVKARGRGLTLPLSGFWFELPIPTRDGIRIRFTPAVADDPARWQFSLDRLGADHVVATAIERAGAARVRITRYEAVPHRDVGASGATPTVGQMVLDPGPAAGTGPESGP